MGGGSVNQHSGTTIGIGNGQCAFAEKLLKIMRRFRLPAKITDRKGDYLVYIKEGNGVSHFLQYIGLPKPILPLKKFVS